MRIKLLIVLISFFMGFSLSSPVFAGGLSTFVEAGLPFTTRATPAVFDRFEFDARERNLAGHNLCVVGSDKLSLYWLENRKDLLLNYRVVCYLANVSTLSEIDTVRQAAHPVPIVLTSADALVSIFNLRHYPAIIHSNWVFQ